MGTFSFVSLRVCQALVGKQVTPDPCSLHLPSHDLDILYPLPRLSYLLPPPHIHTPGQFWM